MLVFLRSAPYPVAEAKPVLTPLARCTGSDHTHSCDHAFRVPGTLNWPSRKKVEKGRSQIPFTARLTIPPAEPGLRLDELRATILERYPDAFDREVDAGKGTEFDSERTTELELPAARGPER